MYSDGQVIRDCESMIVTCTGPATATACRFLSRRVQRPVVAGCLFRGAALILGVASFLDGATARRCGVQEQKIPRLEWVLVLNIFLFLASS